jgi:ABC-2 type transport system permease protein
LASVGAVEALDLGEPIKGPGALSGGWRRTLQLTVAIAKNDFKLRFFGSVLGYVWQLMRPLLLFGVLYIIFTQVVPLGDDLEYFPVALLLGIVLFTFFAEATSGAVSCVVVRENLVRKIHFPRIVIPLAVVLTACFNLVLNLVVVVLFALASDVPVRATWLLIFPLLIGLVIFTVGLAMLLSALYVRYRDVQPIWDVTLQITFYGSLILVPYETIRDKHEVLASALVANPLATVLQEARHLVIDPGYVNAADAMGGAIRLLVPFGIAIGTFLLGLWVFNREAPRIAEEL